MAIHLVRHAKAGKRSRWAGDDRLRPLDEAGRAQALALAAVLARRDVAGPLLSSPFLRCRQTLEPLADVLGTKVEDHDALVEGAPLAATLDLLHDVDDGAALCSHGDVIPDVLGALLRGGAELKGEPDWRKATTWVLERDGDRFVTAWVLPPPPAGT